MPPSVAAVVFLAFIVWLLRRDASRASTSSALWLPTLSLSVMASKPLVYWLYGNTSDTQFESYLGGNPIDRNVLISLFCIGSFILLRRGLSLTSLAIDNWSLTVLMLFMGLSVLWADYPFVAFKRYIRELVHIVMILVVLTDRHPTEAMRRVLTRCVYLLVPLSVLYIKYYPELGRYYARWTWQTVYSGVTTNKNSLGLLAMLGGVVLTWRLLEARGEHRSRAEVLGEVAVLVMSLWLLSIANSKTALACFFIAVLAFIGCRMRWMKWRPTRLTWCLSIALVVSAVLLWSPTTRGFVAESLGRDATLTTRTDIWAAVLGLRTNVLVGAGYGSVWLTDAGSRLAEALEVPHSHNGYLETYLNLGVVGLALLIVFLFSAMRSAVKQLAGGSAAGPFLVAMCLSGMIYNYSEVTFGRDNVISFCLLLAAIRAPKASNESSLVEVVAPSRWRVTTRTAPGDYLRGSSAPVRTAGRAISTGRPSSVSR